MLSRQDIEIVREDSGTTILDPVDGDYSGYNSYVTFKEDEDQIKDRLIEKSSLASEVRCTYNGSTKQSTFEFDYVGDDTRDLTLDVLVYDVECVDKIDTKKKKTPIKGSCRIIGDIRNELNGLDLPPTAERLMPILASNFEDEEIVKCKTINGVKTYVGTDLFDGVFQLDENGDLMPVTAPLTSMYFEIDGNGDIQPRE